LYRRICFHLFESEASDKRLQIEYLLETQSVALRHKACSIQIKNKRKANIDEELFARITDALSFERKDIVTTIEKMMPKNCVATALILVEMKTLCVVRVEKGVEPILYRLKYEQRYSEEFKQIIAENDLSMKTSERLKFWTRLNQRLAAFSEELDTKVLSYARGLLLGSFTTVEVSHMIEKLRKDVGIESLSSEQNSLLYMVLTGLEFLENQEIREAVESVFKKDVERIFNCLVELKPKLTDLPRKHVCLLVDKVNFFLFTN